MVFWYAKCTELGLIVSQRHYVFSACNSFRHFPVSHWRKLWSTNLLKRINEEIKSRIRVVGIFPNDAAITCLVGAVMLELDERWQLEGRRMFSLDLMAAIPPSADALPELDQPAPAKP